MKFLVVIPARYKSSRLLGKPLIKLCGVPMIVRTYQQCVRAVPAEQIVVATDDDRIRTACETSGIRVVMTSSSCLTGTDRLAEVARMISARTYINVQGDEPVFNPLDLRALIDAAGEYPNQIINGYCKIDNEEMFRSSSTPKVVIRLDGRLLYMSRGAIPTDKNHGFQGALRQVCAYAFPKDALKEYTSVSAKTPLEAIEDIEILRFLELGWEVRMIKMSDQSVAVDTVEDVSRAESAIRKLGLQ